MSQFNWHDVKPFLVDGYDLAADGEVTMQIDIPGTERVNEDSTGIGGNGWETSILTDERKATGDLSYTAFYDTAANASNAAVVTANPTSARVIVVGYEGGTVGTRFLGASGWQISYKRPGQKGSKLKISETLKPTGQVDDQGRILKALSAVTADGNSQAASVDNAASSANGGMAYFEVTAYTAGTATGLVNKVMHSTDNVTFAALATAANVTAAPAKEAVLVATGVTVNRYLAGLWDYGGTPDGSTTATIFIGFARR